jgi:membrane-bound metal-dependent hydrolase YbcI (DUF457 family)
MPQMGLHMTLGLLGTTARSRIPRGARTGFVIGSILPDLDFLLLIPIYSFDRDLALSLHRSFTHSLLVVAGIALMAFLLRLSNTPSSSTLLGCALGMVVHDVLDVFMWFAPVGLLWPFGESLNVLDGARVPDLFWNLSFSLEPAAYALFLILLRRQISPTSSGDLRVLTIILLVCSGVLVPAGIAMSRREFEAIAYGVAILVGFIPSSYYFYKFRHQLLGGEKHECS